MTVTIPTITCDDLNAFHSKHFATHAFDATRVLNIYARPLNAESLEVQGNESTYDDGLGFYHDGVKRTLTDEHIQIFRHSEIQAILRQKRLEEEASRDADSRHNSIDGETRTIASGEHATFDDVRETCEKQARPLSEKPKNRVGNQVDDVQNLESSVQTSSTGVVAPRLQNTSKKPADFRRRLVSYEDA